MLSIVSCQRESFNNEFTITQLVDYTNCNNTSCNAQLAHEGEQVSLIGYIDWVSLDPKSNRFQLFEESNYSSSRMDINVVKDSANIFDELYSGLNTLRNPHSDFLRISVRGNISGADIHIGGIENYNAKCAKLVYLVIDKKNDIRFACQ